VDQKELTRIRVRRNPIGYLCYEQRWERNNAGVLLGLEVYAVGAVQGLIDNVRDVTGIASLDSVESPAAAKNKSNTQYIRDEGRFRIFKLDLPT